MRDDVPRPAWQVITCPECGRNQDPAYRVLHSVDERRQADLRCRGGHEWEVRWRVEG